MAHTTAAKVVNRLGLHHGSQGSDNKLAWAYLVCKLLETFDTSNDVLPNEFADVIRRVEGVDPNCIGVCLLKDLFGSKVS